MLTIAKLFGKSPFAPLQTHMDKVASCIAELPALFKALLSYDSAAIERIADTLSRLEQEAYVTKRDIETHLPKSLFLPVARDSLLEMLSLQDSLVSKAGKIAQLARMRKLELLSEMQADFSALCEKMLESFWLARKVMHELEELLECSFGGIEAEKVKGMVDQICSCTSEILSREDHLIRCLYVHGDRMPHPVFYLFLTLIQEIGQLARLSEKLGHRVRMLLELK